MLRLTPCLLAVNIPRSVWDPAHFNTNWSDSYSSDIAARRHWPAKKWSVGLEPRTPHNWLRFSYRNLAYAYNGALRACQSFPEMLVYYKEMKQRGVKVDVDTMNALLTRAARHERFQVDDVFLLFDELITLGARPDISAVETLHTVFDHSAAMPREWREARRRQLVELYNYLAMEEIERLAPHRVDLLLKEQIRRYRDNLRLLRASLSPSVYRRYLHATHSATVLLEEVHNFLWELVESNHPAMEIPSLQLRVPFVASVMKRPPPNLDMTAAPKRDLSSTEFEDADVCSVFLAAAERAVDADFQDAKPISERRLFLSLLTMLSYSGVLYTADLMAHLMEMVKYSKNDASRDADAQRILRYAVRGSSATQDDAYRMLWHEVELVVDSRVVGRYLSSRDPWSSTRICFDEKGVFKSYPTPLLRHSEKKRTSESGTKEEGQKMTQQSHNKDDNDDDMQEGVRFTAVADAENDIGSDTALEQKQPTDLISSPSVSEQRTVEALDLRWSDVRSVVERTGALTTAPSERHPQREKMEVFTGMAVFLRTVATGQRYGCDSSSDEVLDGKAIAGGNNGPAELWQQRSSLFVGGYKMDVWARVFSLVQEVRQDMEKFMADNSAHHVEPEFECWEALIVTLRCILDFCAVYKQEQGGREREDTEKLFQEAMELRNTLIEESRTRFGGRMRILWLQEA